MKIILVCGARPNFMKVAPMIRAIERHNHPSNANSIEPVLGVGSGTHAEQTGRVMIEFEKGSFPRKP